MSLKKQNWFDQQWLIFDQWDIAIIDLWDTVSSVPSRNQSVMEYSMLLDFKQ